MKPAQIIWKQISIQTKMACGARKATVGRDGNTLTFKVTNKPHRYVEVTYLPFGDCYKVEHFRLKRNDYSRVPIAQADHVFVDTLNETIYGMVNR